MTISPTDRALLQSGVRACMCHATICAWAGAAAREAHMASSDAAHARERPPRALGCRRVPAFCLPMCVVVLPSFWRVHASARMRAMGEGCIMIGPQPALSGLSPECECVCLSAGEAVSDLV